MRFRLEMPNVNSSGEATTVVAGGVTAVVTDGQMCVTLEFSGASNNIVVSPCVAGAHAATAE
jgi:hypothetical protein